ncbi:hypothetical protein RDI58_017894 [Solanum bulbocastanum]|uniref:DUF4283 domain-containing protein n=1 Tax=Solanum bulbocastanum TaxID=147425 RepID=A0AAN8TAM1_SOLBU
MRSQRRLEMQRKVQRDQDTTLQQTRAVQNTYAREPIGIPNEIQHGIEDMENWRVKEKINTKETTIHQSKEEGRQQPNNNSKVKSGKSVNIAPNNHDHSNTPGMNLHNSRNECEKGKSVMQACVNVIERHIERNNYKVHNVDTKIPSTIKVFSNFDVHRPNQQKTNQSSPKHNKNKPHASSSSIRNTNQQIPNPSPPTITQSLATRLRANQIKNATPLDIIFPIITTRQGYPSITFHEEDFIHKMPGRCKYTLVDLDNEADHISVWTKHRMFIAGHSMKLNVWTPTFKLGEEIPIVPIWITLSELPWHCYDVDILTPLLSPIGKAIYLDSANMQKTRGSVAKVRVLIDITKERPQHMWIGFFEKDPTLGKWKIIEFEDVPPYFLYCKHQGHIVRDCPVKNRDEEIKKKEGNGSQQERTRETD